jgi:hypothetical protein
MLLQRLPAAPSVCASPKLNSVAIRSNYVVFEPNFSLLSLSPGSPQKNELFWSAIVDDI